MQKPSDTFSLFTPPYVCKTSRETKVVNNTKCQDENFNS
jgi:hypothetical protein